MHVNCPNCGRTFEREAGFFLGAIYFNYGVTSLMATVAYPLLVLTKTCTPQEALAWTMAFVIVFPLWFFRYARSLWLGFDEFMDPRTPR